MRAGAVGRRIEATADVNRGNAEDLALHERSRYRAPARHARRVHAGPVGELVFRELSAYADFGRRFTNDGLIPQLAHPSPRPDDTPPISRPVGPWRWVDGTGTRPGWWITRTQRPAARRRGATTEEETHDQLRVGARRVRRRVVLGEAASLLEKEGHRVSIAELPSTGTDPAGLTGLAEDAVEVRRVVATAGEPVVLVGDSYGGMVITELADHPDVAHSVYVSAFWPARGQSILDMLGDGPPPAWIVPSADGTAIRVTDDVAVAVEALYADLDPARVQELHGHLMFSAAAVLGAPSTAPDRNHPVTYVVLEHDNAIPAVAQEAMAARADHVERLPTSHCAMLADPEGLAAVSRTLATSSAASGIHEQENDQG